MKYLFITVESQMSNNSNKMQISIENRTWKQKVQSLEFIKIEGKGNTIRLK